MPFFRVCNSFNSYRGLRTVTEERKKEESQKIDDLPGVLETCQSGTLAILCSKVNGPVAHGSAQ